MLEPLVGFCSAAVAYNVWHARSQPGPYETGDTVLINGVQKVVCGCLLFADTVLLSRFLLMKPHIRVGAERACVCIVIFDAL